MDEETRTLEHEKALLELRKLHNDIHIAKFNKWAQFVTPLSVIVSGTLVLVLFQRPQLDQMEATRRSSERIQIGNTLNSALQLSDSKSKKQMLDALSLAWPQYDEIRMVAQANNLVTQGSPTATNTSRTQPSPSPTPTTALDTQPSAEPTPSASSGPPPSPTPANTSGEPCSSLSSRISELGVTYQTLRARYEMEVTGSDGSGRVGIGPLAAAVRQQSLSVKAELDKLHNEAIKAGCRS